MPHVSANGAKIYYETHGSGEPLLMIPGFGANATLYWANIPALAERFHVIAYDPRGAGRSDVPPAPYSMQMHAEDAIAVIEAAGERSAHVFSTSMGGMIAQNLALLYPERVRRLVLCCTTPGGTHHVLPPPEALERFIAAASIEDPAAAVRSTYPLHYSDAYVAEHDAEIVARSLATSSMRSTPEGRAGQLAAVQEHDTYDRLPEIKAPTLVAHGEEDGIIPVQNGRILAERIPKARLVIYPRAKHIFFVECAAELNAEVMAFLTEPARERVA